jgi:hypothetical protein
VAKTANLFATRAVLEAIGPFPNDFRSGGDVLWTRQATSQGFKIVYSQRAEVAHPTRRLAALLKKQYRVGWGHHDIRSAERDRAARLASNAPSSPARRRSALGKLARTLRGFMPGSLSAVRESLRQNQVEGVSNVYRVWLVAWLCRAVTTLGSLSRAGAKQLHTRRVYAIK